MRLVCILLIALLSAPQLYAQETQAKEASVRQLLAITHSERLLNSIFKQLDISLEKSIRESVGSQALNSKQKLIVDDMRKQLGGIYKSALSWEQYEPALINIYRKTFTESQVEAMVKFYKSPAGRAMIEKMPVVMQASMRAAQSRMRQIMPKIRALQQETVRRMNDAKESK